MLDLTGLQWGRFHIEEVLGMGGYGVVYRARDPEMQGVVAIKMLNKLWAADEKIASRFLREAELALQFDHPNIIKVHEAGQLYGQPYHVMEYFRGTTLTEWIQADPDSSPSVLCTIAQQVASALDYMHACGLIHRDIKPNNILMDADNHVKLVDYGLSLSTHGLSLREREIAGTPHFMAPEQHRGRGFCFQTDIFCLALTLCYLMKCRDAVKVSARGTDILIESIEPWLRSVLARALADNPEKRHETAVGFADEFCEALEREDKV